MNYNKTQEGPRDGDGERNYKKGWQHRSNDDKTNDIDDGSHLLAWIVLQALVLLGMPDSTTRMFQSVKHS